MFESVLLWMGQSKPVSYEKYTNEDEEMGKLLLFNSGHIWDDVIQQLHKATGYSFLHCEQIAMIAHTSGKATVKTGPAMELACIQFVLREIDLVTKIV
jgi:ATP-dependent Clp protease adapter protein ClpS